MRDAPGKNSFALRVIDMVKPVRHRVLPGSPGLELHQEKVQRHPVPAACRLHPLQTGCIGRAHVICSIRHGIAQAYAGRKSLHGINASNYMRESSTAGNAVKNQQFPATRPRPNSPVAAILSMPIFLSFLLTDGFPQALGMPATGLKTFHATGTSFSAALPYAVRAISLHLAVFAACDWNSS
jgi:hypothetical protein